MFSQNSVASLKTEFDKLSKIMGASEVRTTFNGEGAYTNGKVINLPAMDMNEDMTARDQAIARGYHIHEVGHITDTDFSLASAKKPSKEIHRYWNTCEDVMIERKAIDKFSGAKRSLSATVDSVLANENKHWSDNPEENKARRDKWWTEVPYAALQQARYNAGYESEALEAYVADMPDLLAKEARNFADEMTAAADTAECYELAKKIKRRVAALEKKYGKAVPTTPQMQAQQKGNDGKGDDGSDQQSRDEDQSGLNDYAADDDEGDDDEGNGNGNGDGDGDGDEDGAGSVSGAGGFDLEAAEKREQDNMSAVLGAYGKTFGVDTCKDIASVYETHVDCWKDRLKIYPNRSQTCNSMIKYAKDAVNHAAGSNLYARSKIPSDVNSYGSRLARLLLSQESKRNEGGHSSGRVDRRRLAQLVAGNENIFARTEYTKTSETRLMLAVDGSSSMSVTQTIAAIHVVNDALGRAGVKFDVSEWAAYEGHSAIVMHKHAHQNYKTLQETLTYQPCGGDTPSYSALLSYAQMMVNWQEPRKVLLMITDGIPNDGNVEITLCSDLISQMEASGIEVIGIGINVDVGRMFTKYVQTDFTKLGETLLGSLEKLLISQGHAHGS